MAPQERHDVRIRVADAADLEAVLVHVDDLEPVAEDADVPELAEFPAGAHLRNSSAAGTSPVKSKGGERGGHGGRSGWSGIRFRAIRAQDLIRQLGRYGDHRDTLGVERRLDLGGLFVLGLAFIVS